MVDVFICYSTKHPVYAYLIEDILRGANYTWFRDRLGIRPAAEWRADIDLGISQATVLVAFITEAALASDEVKREITLAKLLNKPCISLVMERLDHIGTRLSELELDGRQAIEFYPENGLVTGTAQFLEALKRETDTWAPLEKNIDKLGHYSWKVRLKAVMELGRTKDMRVLPSLVEAFDVEDSDQVMGEIARQMVDFNDQRAVDLVFRTINSQAAGQDTYTDARELLNEMNNRYGNIEKSLISSLERTVDEGQKVSGAIIICQFGKAASDFGLETLVHLATSGEDVHIRDHAIYLITKTGHPEAKATLQAMLDSEEKPNVRDYIQQQMATF